MRVGEALCTFFFLRRTCNEQQNRMCCGALSWSVAAGHSTGDLAAVPTVDSSFRDMFKISLWENSFHRQIRQTNGVRGGLAGSMQK